MVSPELAVLGGVVAMLVGVVGFGIRAIVTGRLVPRSQLDDVLRDRDEWRKFGLETLRQNGQLVHGAQVVSSALEKLPTPERR